MKNQGENKNRNNAFDSHEFIHFIADLTGPFFHVLLSNILYVLYIYHLHYILYIYYIYILFCDQGRKSESLEERGKIM